MFEITRFFLKISPVIESYGLCCSLGLNSLVLMRKQDDDGQWRPVRAGSIFFPEAETRYAMNELGLVAVAWVVKKCNLFLDGLPHFDIRTDHAPA